MKKITSFTHHTTAEGERISYTFSEISDEGEITRSNVRQNLICTDEKILEAIKTVNEFLTKRLEA